MKLQHLVQQFVYRIEPKPEGGFIARATDPTVPPLEAPTREELQQKIQAKVMAGLGEAFPGLQLRQPGQQIKLEMHIDREPGGGFSVHSDDPNAATVDPATHEKMDQFAEELLGFIDKHFPQLSEQIAAQVGGRDLKVFTTQGANVTVKGTSTATVSQFFRPAPSMQAGDTPLQDARFQATTIESPLLHDAVLTNTPITPEASSSGAVLRFFLVLLVIAAMMYFYLHRS
jgi:hypothetical protein